MAHTGLHNTSLFSFLASPHSPPSPHLTSLPLCATSQLLKPDCYSPPAVCGQQVKGSVAAGNEAVTWQTVCTTPTWFPPPPAHFTSLPLCAASQLLKPDCYSPPVVCGQQVEGVSGSRQSGLGHGCCGLHSSSTPPPSLLNIRYDRLSMTHLMIHTTRQRPLTPHTCCAHTQQASQAAAACAGAHTAHR